MAADVDLLTDWSHAFGQRARNRGAAELTAILAGSPPGVLSMTGGFPNPATFPGDLLQELLAEVLREDPLAALQYTPCEGLPGLRDYLVDRQELVQGRRPATAELIVTSGGMECLSLAAQSLIDPGDVVLVEDPTYLGALMAFRALEADVRGIPTDADGLCVDALEAELARGSRLKFVYVIPDHQNPTGRSLTVERRHALVDACRRHRLLILEDVAYRELTFAGEAPPSLWSLAPDVVVQAGTFSKTFLPGVRLGWAVGPADVVAQLAAAKQTSDQCAGGLGQRLVEAYGRGGHFEARLPAARELYASQWRALAAALERHLPDGSTWTAPSGGFLTWVTLPEGVDTLAMRPAATAAGVAYVPGPPFHVGDDGHRSLRLSFSHLPPAELDEAVARLAGVVRAQLA